MLRLRPYKASDADTILTWCRDERTFYRWSAGMLGGYPPTRAGFAFAEALTPFTAFDGSGLTGFFTLRRPDGAPDELRFGFVIVDPARRGKGYGKAMLQLGLRYAFEVCGARRATLGVFENNPAAYHCYRAAGFRDVTPETPEAYRILGEVWHCREMAAENPKIDQGGTVP